MSTWLVLGCVWCTLSFHWRKFPGSYWLHIASWLELGLRLFCTGILSGVNQDRSCACCHGPCELKWASARMYLENAVSWSYSSPLAFYSLSTFSSTCVPEPWGEGFNGLFLLGLSAPKSFTLNAVQLWVSILISIYCKKSLFWWVFSNAMLYDCNNI